MQALWERLPPNLTTAIPDLFSTQGSILFTLFLPKDSGLLWRTKASIHIPSHLVQGTGLCRGLSSNIKKNSLFSVPWTMVTMDTLDTQNSQACRTETLYSLDQQTLAIFLDTKIQYKYTQWVYSTIKKNKIRLFVRKCIELEIIAWSKITSNASPIFMNFTV